MSLRALLFDVDGTLIDTEELHRSAFNDAFRRLGDLRLQQLLADDRAHAAGHRDGR